MPDNINNPAPTPEAVAAKPDAAVRHDTAPVAAATHQPAAIAKVEAKADQQPAPAKATKLKLVLPKPVAKAAMSKPAAQKTVAVAPAPEPEVKRKRGRPPGAKTLASKAPTTKLVAKPSVAKTSAPKPVPVAAKPVQTKPVQAKPVQTKPIKTPTKPVAPIAVATPSEGRQTMNDTMAKIQETAKKFTGEAGARTQAMFGDMSSRAKGAYEKSVKMTEELTEFQKGNVEAMVESSKLAAKAAETLGQGAADYARKSYETGTAAFKTFASAKSPTELFKLQSDYLKSYFDSAVAESSKVTESWLKLVGEVAQPISNRVAVAVEKVKLTAAI